MSAAELRQAAETLRERAGKTRWVPECGAWWNPEPFHIAEADTTVAEAQTRGEAAYIAIMHPGVGLALADWLAHYASVIDAQHPIAFADDAFAVARAINDGAS